MTASELNELVKVNGKVLVRMTKKIESGSAELEENQLAYVTGVDFENRDDFNKDYGLIEIIVDQTDFQEFNKKLEKSCWQNLDTGKYTDKYSDMFHRKNQCSIFDKENNLETFEIVESKENELIKEYLSEERAMSYVAWLETLA